MRGYRSLETGMHGEGPCLAQGGGNWAGAWTRRPHSPPLPPSSPVGASLVDTSRHPEGWDLPGVVTAPSTQGRSMEGGPGGQRDVALAHQRRGWAQTRSTPSPHFPSLLPCCSSWPPFPADLREGVGQEGLHQRWHWPRGFANSSLKTRCLSGRAGLGPPVGPLHGLWS